MAAKTSHGRRRSTSPSRRRPMITAELLEMLGAIANDLISSPAAGLDAAIDRCLGQVGSSFQVDRAYVFQIAETGDEISNTHEWCAAGVVSTIDRLQHIPTHVYPWWMGEMRAGRPIDLPRLDFLPPEAWRERALLEPQGIQSLLVLPITLRGHMEGFVGFDHVRRRRLWSGEEVAVLRITASAVANAFERQTLEESRAVASLVFEHIEEGVFAADVQGRILEINTAFTRITGYLPEEVIGRTGRIFAAGLQDRHVAESMWQAVLCGSLWRGEVWKRRKDGALFLVDLTVTTIRNAAGRILRYVCTFSDITEAREKQLRLNTLAHMDALTHLPNRSLFDERLDEALVARRRSSTILALVALDLDQFKHINDTLGRQVGDRVLVEVARRLQAIAGPAGTVCRRAGDEFTMLLCDLESTAHLDQMLSRVQETVGLPVTVPGALEVALCASLGVRIVPPDDADPDALLRQADQALYLAKKQGRGHVCRFDPRNDRDLRRRRDIVTAVAAGLHGGEMVLHFQPVVDLTTGEVVFAEALIRWERPGEGLVLPGQWLPHVQDDPLMLELDVWVLDQALEACASWMRQGFSFGVSINVSAQQLHDPGFPQTVRQGLNHHPGVPAARLKMEVLESAALADMGAVSSTMHACQGFGVEFALDDFGTGYASLAYLKHLPARSIKIDRSFVDHISEDEDAFALVRGVIHLAGELRLIVIAEGVENASQAARLRSLGCNLAQGYHISPPLPLARLLDWVRTRRPA